MIHRTVRGCVWPIVSVFLFSCCDTTPTDVDHDRSAAIAKWRSSKDLSVFSQAESSAYPALASWDGNSPKSGVILRWKRPSEGDVMDIEDMSQWGVELELNAQVSQEALQVCVPSSSHTEGVHPSRCAVIIEANKFVVVNQSCAVDCSAQGGPCHVSCPTRPTVKGTAGRDGVYHLEVFVEVSDESGSRRLLAPPSTYPSPSYPVAPLLLSLPNSSNPIFPRPEISVLVGEDTSDLFANFLSNYASVHHRSRTAPRVCAAEDEQEAWESGRCLRALIYRCGDSLCGGYTDRMKGIFSVFLLALFSGRSFFVEYARPRRLSELLEPNRIDWTPDSVDLVANRRQLLDQSQWIDTEILDPSGARRFPNFFIPLVLEPSVAVISLATNLNIFPALSNLPGFYSFAWEAGLLGLMPSPSAHCYEFLFRHSATFQQFFTEQLMALPYPSPILSHLATPPAPAPARGRKIRLANGPRDGVDDGILIGLQLRCGRTGWYDPSTIETQAHVQGALECTAFLAAELGVATSQAYVLLVTSTPRLYDWAVEQAPTVGLNVSRISGVRPDVVAHLDREPSREVASEAMNYIVLENELMSRASALVVTSGFGECPADYGGIPLRFVVNVKWDLHRIRHDKSGRVNCRPNMPDVWF